MSERIEYLRKTETLLDGVAKLLLDIKARPKVSKRIVRDERGAITRVEEDEVDES